MSDLIERPDRLQLVRFSDLVNLPPAPWLVKGVVRESSVVMMYGRRASYKSFVALSLAGSVSTGIEWMGHPVITPGLVIYIAAEGGGGMVQRARAWAEQHDLHPTKINMRFITEPLLCLPDSDDMNVLIDRIREAIDWHPEGTVDEETGDIYEHPTAREWPQMIVVDTLARCFYGDENKQEDMGAFVQGIDRLKMEFNCTLLVIHHSGLDGSRERGSTVFGSACDTVYRLDAEDPPEMGLLLTSEKMKESKDPDPLPLVRREVTVSSRPTDDPNEDLSSIVIETVDSDRTEKQSLILSVLALQGPLTWSQLREAVDLPKSSFQRFLVDLQRKGQIAKENGVWAPIGSTT